MRWTVALISLLFLSTALAEELLDPGLTPDDPFYIFDRFAERIKLLLTLNKEERVRLHITFAEE
ncbi:MAG TPA: hypothetical protein ENG45_01575, partial [Candidatus Aenigmarchaeota archaeon]|nr:hypothetical protein [Candidatus Aenigmarchaeota archaeon]